MKYSGPAIKPAEAKAITTRSFSFPVPQSGPLDREAKSVRSHSAVNPKVVGYWAKTITNYMPLSRVLMQSARFFRYCPAGGHQFLSRALRTRRPSLPPDPLFFLLYLSRLRNRIH